MAKNFLIRRGEDAEIDAALDERIANKKTNTKALDELERAGKILKAKAEAFRLEWWGKVESRLIALGRLESTYVSGDDNYLEIDDDNAIVNIVGKEEKKGGGIQGLLDFLRGKNSQPKDPILRLVNDEIMPVEKKKDDSETIH